MERLLTITAIRRNDMLKRWGLLLTALLFVFVPVMSVYAADFEGQWVGHWKAITGERGNDSLSLRETHHGELKGIWNGRVKVEGRQTDENRIHLHGVQDNGVRVDIKGHLKHGELHLDIDKKAPAGTITELWSELHRR